MKTHSFSIIIPALNEGKYLPKLLDDLANQSFQNFEIIIVDGKSDDNTVAKAKKYKDKFNKLTIITSQKRNVSYQRNLGVKSAKSEWVLFMDADNRLPNYFLQGIKYRMESLGVDMFSTWMSTDLDDIFSKIAATMSNIQVYTLKATKKPFIFESFLAIKKDIFLNLHGFDEQLPFGEGNEFIKRAVSKNYKYTVIRNPKYTYSYRRITANGKLKHLLKVIPIEIARLVNIKIPLDKAKKLYPMKGGKYFETNTQTATGLKKIHPKNTKVI